MLSISAQEIKYNLDILNGKVAYPSKYRSHKITAQDYNTTSLEFLEIFAEAIQFIEATKPEDKKVTNSLNQSLAEVAGRIYDALENKAFNCSDSDHDSLIWKKLVSPNELANICDFGKVKDGLNKLPENFAIRRIKGDGHCLFRAIALGIAINYEKSVHKKEFIRHLEHLKLSFPIIGNDIAELASILENQKSAYDTMQDPKTSDFFVSCLRKIACEYNRRHQDEVSRFITESDFPIYLEQMSNMKLCKYGGPPEITALSQSFGITVNVIDVSVQDKEDLVVTPFEPAQETNFFEQGIDLLYLPGHFDYLQIKKGEA